MTDRIRETTGEVEVAVLEMYSSYGDPARFDRVLHQEITIWESDQPGPLLGLTELDALRGDRASGSSGSRPTLAVNDLLVDRWGQVAAVARYVLSARSDDGIEEFRVTDVLQHGTDGWRIVHHHAEALLAAVDGQHDDGAPGHHEDRGGQGEEIAHAG